MSVSNDFLEEPRTVINVPGSLSVLEASASIQNGILTDAVRELRKQHPEVMAMTRVQGSNKILAGDTSCHKVYFEIGGMPITVHKIVLWSTFDGVESASVNSYGRLAQGFGIGVVPTVLDISVDSLYVMTDGSNDCEINGSVTDHGGISIYGFTIPDYDRHIDRPL